MSRIRTNLITNRMANGAPTVSNGLVISGVTTITTLDLNGDLDVDGHLNADNVSIAGVVTATSFAGDGSALTGITQTTINNNANNRLITGSGTANTLEGEANLTYDGTNLRLGTTTAAIGGGTGLMVASSTGARIKLCDSDAGVTANDGFEIIAGNGGTGYINNKENQSIVISTNNTERMRVTHEGSVGIGTNTSTYELEVVDATGASALRMKDAANNVICDLIANSTGGLLRTTYNHPLVFHTNQVERLRITNTGHTLFSGLTAHNDPRNDKGITVKSTGGVSFQNSGSNGSRNWRIRPDDQSRWGDLDFSVSPTANSATDWPDAASDKVLTLGYDGTVSKPRNPLFVAQKSAVISGGGYVTFNTVIENVGSHYDSSNGRFTAPVAGYYWFCCKINAYRRVDFELRKNQTTGNANREIGQFNTSNQDGWYSHNLIRVLELSANDYVSVYVSNIYQNSDPGEWLTFQGYLLQ